MGLRHPSDGNANRIRWALRKVRLPVGPDALVLDVGAGSCPYPRADILLERYSGGDHRGGAGLVADRPTVLGDALQMPFQDKAFDFVVASHVLEHIKIPELLLKELMRVSHAGYIETPNVFLERLSPYSVHVLELMDMDGTLVIHKKPKLGNEDFIARMSISRKHPAWRKLFFGTPQLFHVRYFWRESIQYHIDNPDESCDWMPQIADEETMLVDTYQGSSWRARGLRALRRYYRWRRPRNVEWLKILACPSCHGTLRLVEQLYRCDRCVVGYQAHPHPSFIEPVI